LDLSNKLQVLKNKMSSSTQLRQAEKLVRLVVFREGNYDENMR